MVAAFLTIGDAMLRAASRDSRGAARELLGKSRTLFNIDAEKMMGVMNVNWLGTVIASQVFAVDLVGVEGNSIINITSMAAYDALSMVPAYASSKAAVDMFTRVFNCICHHEQADSAYCV